MKSARLLIHELELEIQGVSVEWVQQHQDSIVEKLIQAFSNFQINEEQDLFLDFIEIDVGKFHNVQDFIQFLELELIRWNRELIDQSGQQTNQLQTNTYDEFIHNDWDTVFKETKDFFNLDISSNRENIKRKFLEISELLQRNPEQFWRWFQSFGISEDLIIKYRKFLYTHQLPNEAIVAWTTSMLVIKEKKPAESYEQILSQILLNNFTKSTKFSIILKRNEDEFIQYINNSKDRNIKSNENNIIDLSEDDWNSIESIIPWDDLLMNHKFSKNIIHRIPLTYLLKLLKSSYWNTKNTLWEDLSVYLINNNIISKDELRSATSINYSDDLVYSIQQWLNSLPLNPKATQISQLIYLLLTGIQNKDTNQSRLESFLKTLDLEMNQEENDMLLVFLENLIDNINLNKIAIPNLAIKIQQLITLSINLSIKTRLDTINILDILTAIEPNPNILTKSNNQNENIDQSISDDNKQFVQNTEQEKRIAKILKLVKKHYQPLLRLFNSNELILKLIYEIYNIKENNTIKSQDALSSFISQIIKIEDTTYITQSFNHIFKQFEGESEEKQELILWIEWLFHLHKKTNNTQNIPYETWKLKSNYNLNEIKEYLERLNTEVLAIAKSEIIRYEDNSNNRQEIFTEEEIIWLNSFFENIQNETIQFTNQLSGNTIDLYFSYFNLSIINNVNQNILSIQLENNGETEISLSEQNQDARIKNIRKKLTTSVITDLVSQYNNYYSLITKNLESIILDEINIFKLKLETIENAPLNSIKPNQQINEFIAQILFNNYYPQTTPLSEFQPTELIFSTFKIFELWLNNIQKFKKSTLEESASTLEIHAPIFSDVIKEWIHNSKEIDQQNTEILNNDFNLSIKTYLSYFNKLDYLLNEITRSSSNKLDSKINQFYKLNINELISGLYNQINVENHIGATIKLNYLFLNFLTGTAAIINEIIHKQIFNEPQLFQLIDSFLNANNRLPKNIQVSSSNYKLITLLETNYLFQSQIPEIISVINNELKLALITPNSNTVNFIEQNNLKNVIFTNPNQISIDSPLNTWTNNIESTFNINEIFTNVNLFIHFIQNPGEIPIITTDSNTRTAIEKKFTKIEFIQLLFGHPKWRELYVQLTRNAGYGFKQITEQITLLETIQVIESKFPTSIRYNTEIKQLISDVITSKFLDTGFLQTFKFYWIQQTTPPSPFRTLQIILETYFTLGHSNVFEFIQSTIISSALFKRITRLEKKEFDEWIGNQFKKASTTNKHQNKASNSFLNHLSHVTNPIPVDLFVQIKSNQNESIRLTDNESKLNLAEDPYSSKKVPSNNFTNIANSRLSDNLMGQQINNQNLNENSSKIDPNNILGFLGDSFISNKIDWESTIVEIKRLIIINHTISEKIIAEHIYILSEKKIPQKLKYHQLQDILKSIISLSIWFEILDELPIKTYHRFSNFTNSQQEASINLIKNTKNNFSIEQKVNFLNKLITNYLFFKSNHWLFSESYNSISAAIIQIKKNKPNIYKSIVSQIINNNGNLDRHWNLPLLQNNPIVNNRESHDSLKSAMTSQNEKSSPIFFPIIERNWSIWQRNNLFNNENNSQLINIIINNYLTDLSITSSNLFSWIDRILSISYLNKNSLFADLTLNKILINEWFLRGNIKLNEINTYETGLSFIIQKSLNHILAETKAKNNDIDLNFFSLLNEVIKISDNKTHERINKNFEFFHLYLESIHKEIGLIDSNLTRLEVINRTDLLEIYNFNLLKFFLSVKQRSTDWIFSNFNTLKTKKNIDSIINALKQSQNKNSNNERDTAINNLEKFQQILNEIVVKKLESPLPVYWEISTQLILNAVIDSSIDLIDWTDLSELKSEIMQNKTVVINELFDRELLKESIRENVVASIETIESTFNQTSNIEFSLILYWLSENINFQLDNYRIQENSILNSFNEKSSQLPETDHISELIIQPLMLLNYESGLSTNDYFKETLIPILLLTAAYNKSKQISNILDSYKVGSRIPADIIAKNDNESTLKTGTKSPNINLENEHNHSKEIDTNTIDQNIEDITQESAKITEGISTDKDVSTIEGTSKIEHITKEVKTSFNEKISPEEDIITTKERATGEGISSIDGISPLGGIKSTDDTSAIKDTPPSEGSVTTDDIETVDGKTFKDNILEKSAPDVIATNKSPLIQLPYSIDSIVQQLFNGQPDKTGQLQKALEDVLRTIPNSEIDKIVAKIKEIWEKQIKPLHILEGHIQQPDLFNAIEGIPSVKKIEIKKTEEIKQDNATIKRAVNQGTRFATGLCGMIMLAPYYGTLFRRMNLIENNNFKSELEQLKAYSIIFHIAKLHEETPSDYQDLVPRIIVGIPPEASISGILQLTADELEEIEKFLTAVKSQWKLMNNVTLRGFIQSFLLRTGKVWKEGDKWKIEVDTHGADIILKTVPWGFSFIKYPWNPYIIETKWELD